MAIIYSLTAINARLQGVVSAIGAGGHLNLIAGGVAIASIDLANPCGTVAGGILTFSVPASDFNAIGGGNATVATITDVLGNLMVSGLTVGIPLSGANVIINNGVNTTFIAPTQVVTLISGQIIGS